MFNSLLCYLCANKKWKQENCWRSPCHSKMNYVQLCDVASNRVQPFSVRRSRWPCSLRDRFLPSHTFCSISGELSLRSAWLGHQSRKTRCLLICPIVRLPTPKTVSRTRELWAFALSMLHSWTDYPNWGSHSATEPIACTDHDKFVARNKLPPPSGRKLWRN